MLEGTGRPDEDVAIVAACVRGADRVCTLGKLADIDFFGVDDFHVTTDVRVDLVQ